MIKTSQNVISLKAILKRIDEEEVALQKELSCYLGKSYRLQLRRAQAMGRIKTAQGLRK